jgi:hypothetical protein
MKNGAIVEIVDVVNLYPIAVDARRWELFDQVFTADAKADFGGGARWQDRAALKRDFAIVHTPFDATMHTTTNHKVNVRGDEANCISYVHGRFIRDVPGGNLFESGGWYDDVLVRTPEGWRISSRTCRMVWAAGNPVVLQTMPGVTGEQQLDSLSRAAAAGTVAYLQSLSQGGA